MNTTLGRGLYEVRDVLGSGRWSTVHSCWDPQRDERVAVKVLNVRGSDPVVVREMYNREIRALEGFSHPNVVGLRRAHDLVESGELLLVLDLVDRGVTLDRLLDADPSDWPMDWRLQQALGLLDALDRAHQRGVIHRDLKPSNLLVDRVERTLRISDFGIAQIAAHYARGDSATTLRAYYTRPFAAPEQRLDEHSTPASDLYSFAWVLASLLMWRRPTANDSRSQIQDMFCGDSTLANVLGNHHTRVGELLAGLLLDDCSSRPRLADVRQVLATTLDSLTPVVRIPVVLTDRPRRQLAEAGVKTAAALADLNSGLKFRFDPKGDGRKSDSVRCFGTRGVARLSFDAESNDVLMVDWYELEPDKIARETDRLDKAPFLLFEGRGTGARLLDYAAREHRRAVTDKIGATARREFVGLAAQVLQIQREVMGEFWARYEIVDNTAAPPVDDWKAKLAALGGQAVPSTVSAQGEVLRLKLLKIWPKELAAEPDDDGEAPSIPESFWDALNNEAATYDLEVQKQSIGSLYGLEPLRSVIAVRTRRGPTLTRRGVLRIFDKQLDVALKRQDSALGSFQTESAVNPTLAERLLAPESNTLDPQPPVEPVQEFLRGDKQTLELVRRALAARDMFFLQGPPGTGKTTFIAEVISQILLAKPDARILLTSQGNEAVDNAVDRLTNLRGRLGTAWRIVRDKRAKDGQPKESVGFDKVFHEWSNDVHARCLADESTALLQHEGPVDTARVQSALTNWRQKLGKLPDVKKDYAASVHVWAMTLLRVPTLMNLLEDDVEFDYVIVDEAGRATVAEVLVALIRGRRFLLVGDHRQLPPYMDTETGRRLRSRNLSDIDAGISLFENIFDKMPESNSGVLRRQFRMHPSIAAMIGKLYYPDIGLTSGITHADRPLALKRFSDDGRLWWCDIEGGERQFSGSTSWWNELQVLAIEKALLGFDAELSSLANLGDVARYSVGVIATYKDQVWKLQERLSPNAKGKWKYLDIKVATVDSFQGKEEDIILYSIVRAGSAKPGFLDDRRRLNVAFSRAKSLLIVFGDRNIAGSHSAWHEIVDVIPEHNFITGQGGL